MVWLTQVAQMRWNLITISSSFPNRNASEGSIASGSHGSESASCWRNLGSRNTRRGTTKIWSVLPVLKKGRQGNADLLTWPYSGRQCLPSQQRLISPLVLAKKCSWYPIFPFCGCPAPGHSRARPCFSPYNRLLQNLLAVLLSSVKWVLSSSFNEGSELLVSIVFPRDWYRIETHVAVPHRDEGDPKWKLCFRSSLSPSNSALLPAYRFPTCTNSLESSLGLKQ